MRHVRQGRPGVGRERSAGFLAAVGSLVGVLTLAGLLLPAPARAAGQVRVTASIDGRAVAGAADPIRLYPNRPAVLTLELLNTGTTDLEVKTVELAGQALGVTFFAYETAVSMPIPAGGVITRNLELHLGRLQNQASGLLVGVVTVLDGGRHELGTQTFKMDVRGSAWSAYSVFGLTVALVTALSLGMSFLALARGRLHANRWRRGLRFLASGTGVGLTIVFTLSALRVLVPWPSLVPIVLACAAGMFVVGFLTPSPKGTEAPTYDQPLEAPRSW